MKHFKRAWWFPLAVSAPLAASCLDFDTLEHRFCDSGSSAACRTTERDCANGLDDDGDKLIDCGDPDCQGLACSATTAPCTVSTVCQVDGGCGEAPVTCNSPPNFCYSTPGACNPASGACLYAVDTTAACDDSSACTTSDHCDSTGMCSGTPVTCNSPPGACFAPAGCDPILGCVYTPRTGGGCSDGDQCTFNDQCSADGGCAGTPYSCPATECSSSVCLGDGGCLTAAIRTGLPCADDAGICQATGSCLTFPYAPSNFTPITIAARGIAGNVQVTCNAWFNSTDGGQSWCSGQPVPVQSVVAQPGGIDAVVLAMSGLTVGPGGTLTLVGTRPVIMAVWGDAIINGTISARSATGQDAGAGSHPSGQCDPIDGRVAGAGGVGTGGGGGGYGSSGGGGGDLSPGGGGVSGGNPGTPRGTPQIVPLRGGCSGGAGARPNDTAKTGGAGGQGGGAVQLSAAGALQISGTITASGAGGRGGLADQIGTSGEGGNGGGGGGSGGSVLLEASDVLVSNAARLTANGGGGGEGGDGAIAGNDGNSGADGPTTTATGGAGGSGAVSCASDGAAGGSFTGAAGTAANVSFTPGGCATGGGGGAIGRIRVNGSQGCQFDAGVVSPAPSFGGACP